MMHFSYTVYSFRRYCTVLDHYKLTVHYVGHLSTPKFTY